MTRQADNGLIFEGDVKMRNRKISKSGFVDVGNTTSLTTAAATDTQDRVSKRKGSYGQALDSLKTTKPTEIGLKMDTFDKTNLAMALMGEAAIIAAGAQTVTDEKVVIGKRGQLYKLKHGNIDPASIKVKDGSDQAIDADKVIYNDNAGLIGVAADSTVQNGASIKVSYKTRTGGGFKIDAATLSSLDLEIIVDGRNRVTGEAGVLHIPHAVLAADGDIDWFGDDFAEAAFKGTAVLADGQTSSYSFTSYSNAG